jgi:hypothetical protein
MKLGWQREVCNDTDASRVFKTLLAVIIIVRVKIVILGMAMAMAMAVV